MNRTEAYPERYLQDFEDGCGRLLKAITQKRCPDADNQEFWEAVGEFRTALGKLLPNLIALEHHLDQWEGEQIVARLNRSAAPLRVAAP